MPKPVINTTSSVLGFLQFADFVFQPTATNSPTLWTSGPLPPGVTLNAATGQISGPVERPGVYNVPLYAANADGVSAPVIFTIGIEASGGNPLANVIDIALDIGTREVTSYTGESLSALFTGKYRDDIILRIQFHRNGAPCSSLDLTKLKIALKEFDGESVLATSPDDEFDDVGNGVFLLYLSLDDARLKAALDEYEGDEITKFDPICEIEWLATNSLGVGPAALRGSSRHFRAAIVRDLNQLTA